MHNRMNKNIKLVYLVTTHSVVILCRSNINDNTLNTETKNNIFCQLHHISMSRDNRVYNTVELKNIE